MTNGFWSWVRENERACADMDGRLVDEFCRLAEDRGDIAEFAYQGNATDELEGL